MKLVSQSKLLALAWLVATLGLPVQALGRSVNLGFVGAVAIAFVVAVRHAMWRVRGKGRRGVSAMTPVPMAALGVATLALVLPALLNGVPEGSVAAIARGAAALGWSALLVAEGPEIRPALAQAAWFWLALGVLLIVPGLLWPSSGVFERALHQELGTLPRFKGLAVSPAAAGVWAVCCLELSDAAPARLRRAGRVAALGLAAATLSIASFAAALALAAARVQRALLRRVLLALVSVAALSALYFHPLELRVGHRALAVSSLHPDYAERGLGPHYMPIVSLGSAAFGVTGHVTAYARLAGRALECFAEHPWAGVGPGRFEADCAVVTLGGWGGWAEHRRSHNQLGTLLAEAGLCGLSLMAMALALLFRGYRLRALGAWSRGAWLGLLLASFGGEILFTLPVLALAATALVWRGRSPGAAQPGAAP